MIVHKPQKLNILPSFNTFYTDDTVVKMKVHTQVIDLIHDFVLHILSMNSINSSYMVLDR